MSLETSMSLVAHQGNASASSIDSGSIDSGEKIGSKKSSARKGSQDLGNALRRMKSDRTMRRYAFKNEGWKNLVAWIEFFEDLEEPERASVLAPIVNSPWFDNLSSGIIMLNCIYTAFSADWEIKHLGESQTSLMTWSEHIFLLYYFIELIMRLEVHRWYFFVNEDYKWNLFDLVLVSVSILDFVFATVAQKATSVSVSFMRVFRILKLGKIFRTLRVMRVFKDLAIILESFRHCFASLFWCFVMMAFIFYVFALVLLQGVTGYMIEGTLDESKKQDVFLYYGSLTQSMLSLYMAVTGGDDWGNAYAIVEDAGMVYAIVFLFFTFFFVFAVFNILTGVFVEKAVAAAQPDIEARILEQHKQMQQQRIELRDVIRAMDIDSDGEITWSEFRQNMNHDNFLAYFASVGLDLKDVSFFFDLLAEDMLQGNLGEKHVDIDGFVNGCLSMKGAATSLDMQRLLWEVKRIGKEVNHMKTKMDVLVSTATEETSSEVGQVGGFAASNVVSKAEPGQLKLQEKWRHTETGKSLAPEDKEDKSTEQEVRLFWEHVREEISTTLAPQLVGHISKLIEPRLSRTKMTGTEINESADQQKRAGTFRQSQPPQSQGGLSSQAYASHVGQLFRSTTSIPMAAKPEPGLDLQQVQASAEGCATEITPVPQRVPAAAFREVAHVLPALVGRRFELDPAAGNDSINTAGSTILERTENSGNAMAGAPEASTVSTPKAFGRIQAMDDSKERSTTQSVQSQEASRQPEADIFHGVQDATSQKGYDVQAMRDNRPLVLDALPHRQCDPMDLSAAAVNHTSAYPEHVPEYETMESQHATMTGHSLQEESIQLIIDFADPAADVLLYPSTQILRQRDESRVAADQAKTVSHGQVAREAQTTSLAESEAVDTNVAACAPLVEIPAAPCDIHEPEMKETR